MNFAYLAGSITNILKNFLFCYFADKTIEMSRKLPLQLYKSNWVNLAGDKKSRRHVNVLMLVFMSATQREMIFYVGNIFPWSLPTFAVVNLYL